VLIESELEGLDLARAAVVEGGTRLYSGSQACIWRESVAR